MAGQGSPPSQEEARAEELRHENQQLRARLAEVQSTLEELEATVAAIRGGLVDAVVVDREETPEVWGLESSTEFQLRLVLQEANAGTWEWDLGSGNAAWSESLQRLVGLEPSIEPRKIDQWMDLVHPDDRTVIGRQVKQAIEGEADEFYCEFRVLRRDGVARWMASRGKLQRDADGRPERMFGINIDITERRRAEETLRQADRRKDEFLAMLAHELRNPLAAIQNALSLLRFPQLEAEQRHWNQDMLDRQVGQLGRLIDDLLDVSRITQGKVQIKRSPAEVEKLLLRSIESVRPQIEDARHQLTLSFVPDALWTNADAARIEQVFVNVLTNAAKYTQAGGQIAVDLRRDGQEAVVSIRDNGIGIATEMLPRVFDPFTQAERGLDRAQGGLGIGLTLVRRLVEMHGGTVDARSEGPGRGSEFIVRLPLCPRPEERSKKKEMRPSPAIPRKVLVVDDNRDAALALAMLLEASGHSVNVAHSGLQALTAAENFSPDVALLDLGLPEMNGFELAPRLLEHHPKLHLVAISGYGQVEDLRRSKEAGFHDHLVKPTRQDDVLAILARPSP